MALETDRRVTVGSSAFAGSPARATLLEREAELDALQTVVSEAAAGQARVVVVEGSGGIGKTRLLAEAGALAAQAGLRVLSARGGEFEREFAFGIVRQLFEPAVVGSEDSLLTGAATGVREVFELAVPAAANVSDDVSFASLHGLYWLTVNVAGEGPVAIAVDDLHWSDVASLRFLAYLVRRLEGLPVLLVGTLRPLEGAGSAALDEIRGDPLSVSVRPGPLSVAATARLVAERLGGDADDGFVAACQAATAGNPLLLHELLKTLAAECVQPDAAHMAEVSDLGAAASRAVLARLARLSTGAVSLARAVAVLGDDAELSLVAALAGVDVERAAVGVAELGRVEVLEGGRSLRFVHPLVGAAVYRDMSGADRVLLHERAARLLADGGADTERVAAHLLLSPARGDVDAVNTLITAARSSLRMGAPESAIAYLQRALREPPPPAGRAEVLLELGCAETFTNGLDAAQHLNQAYELLDDRDSRTVAALALSKVLLLTGQSAAGARLAQAAAAELPPGRDDAHDRLEALELMGQLMAGFGGDAVARLQRYHRAPVRPTLGARMLAAVASVEWTATGGDSEACAGLALGALAGGDLIAADNGLLAVGPIGVLAVADRPEAIDAADRALAEAHRAGSLFDLTSVALGRGFTLYWRGELADAEESLRSFYQAVPWGIGQNVRMFGDAQLSAVLRERGDLVGARRVLEQSDDPGDDAEATRHWVHSQIELLLAEGRVSEALALSVEFDARFAPTADSFNTPWRSPTALALHRLGRQDEALALANRDLERARRWGAPGTVSRALRTLGTLQGDAGLETLGQAVDVAAGTPARLEHAKALAALGAALRRARRPSDARKPLRDALELAEVLGAEGLAEHARSELHAAGGRRRTTALSGVAALTPSERRVAALAAAGHTNREIAQELFITPKTVEVHLSRAYYKLGVGSRHELPAYASELHSGE
jgi:DNA-binding CsgD family transcriptional regulator